MKSSEKVTLVNKLLHELNSSLDNEKAKEAVLHAYITINKPDKISAQVREIPDAISTLDYDFIALSRGHYHFSDDSMKIYQQLLTLSRTKFGHGWGGLIMMSQIW